MMPVAQRSALNWVATRVTEPNGQLVHVVDDDEAVRDAIGMLLDVAGLRHRCYTSADEFLREYDSAQRGCLVLDVRMPGITGLELQEKLSEVDTALPIIFITGHGDVPMAVEAMRRGAFDFLRKPIDEKNFVERIRLALDRESSTWQQKADQREMNDRLESLTEREREVFLRVAAGAANKAVAADLGISERTVEVHRAQMMKKLGARSVAELVRIHLQIELSFPG